MIRSLLSAVTLLLVSTCLPGQVVINEYSASNLESFQDAFGKTEDWIELYNTSDAAVDISGWHLSDKESKPEKWAIPSGTILPAGGHLVFLCSGRDRTVVDEGETEYHTNFKLSQTEGGDIVLLSDPAGDIQEMHALDITLVEHSRCRSEDGGAEWVVSTAPSFGSSNNFSDQSAGYTAEPSMDVPAGFHTGPVTVTVTNNEPNSFVRFTTDGTNPDLSSPIYTDPLTIPGTTVLKARAFSEDPNILPGKINFNTYLINEDFTLAVFSVGADDVIDLANGNGDLIPIGSIEYFNLEGEREATSFGSLNRHGQDSWVLDHRSLDWISRDEMGYSKAVNAPLFNFSDRDEYQKFMFRNSGDDNYPAIDDGVHDGATHIRDEYVQTLAREGDMELDTRSVERVILFLNGQYWGVYGMRDRPVDHDYTDFYYDQGKYEIEYLSTWGSTDVEYGGAAALNNWIALRDFILDNDMSVEANYEIANDSLDMKSLIDYFLVNSNVVASDWLNYNTGWWRGRNPEGKHKKWGYILWDLDATFDYYINYTGVPNISPDALVCDIEIISAEIDTFFGDFGGGNGGVLDSIQLASCPTILSGSAPNDSITAQVMVIDEFCCNDDWDEICQGIYDQIDLGGGLGEGDGNLENIPGNIGKHEKIFLKLIEESPTFRQLYYSRYADMMNTVFSCENMNATLDSMLATIVPEMPRQISRWGGSMTEWESNVEDLREFVNARCELLGGNLPECYDELSGPFEIVLQTEPDGVGEIDLNTLDIESFPWSGAYYGGMDNQIKAKAFDEFEDLWAFSHWESRSGNVISPDDNSRRATIRFTGPDTLVAVFYDVVSTDEFTSKYGVELFPNPTGGDLTLSYTLDGAADVNVSIYTPLGQHLTDFPTAGGRKVGGEQQAQLQLDADLPSGLYLVKMRIDGAERMFRVNLLR